MATVPGTSGPSGASAQRRLLTQRLTKAPPLCELATLPTPVERLAWMPGQVWIKRDDHTSDRYGGGKTRKLEWLLGSPPFAGSGPVLSVGATGSHHLCACAIHLHDQGRTLHAICFPQPVDPHVRENLGVLASLGVEFWPIRSRAELPLALLAYRTWKRPRELGPFMTAGGSTPLGCFGFVEAGLELAEQIGRGELPRPERIYIAGGTLGSSAGLCLGLALAGVETELRIIAVVERVFVNPTIFSHVLGRVFAELRRHGLASAARDAHAQLARAGVRWTIDTSQIGAGYAQPTADGRAAVELAHEHQLTLEGTYTGKCFAALVRDLGEGRVGLDAPLLVWNTHASTDLRPLLSPNWEARLPSLLRRGLG